METVRDIVMVVGAGLLGIVPLIREIKKPHKNIVYITFLVAVTLVVAGFATWKIISDKIEYDSNKALNESLQMTIDTGQKQITRLDSNVTELRWSYDSTVTRQYEFLEALKMQYKIALDTQTNKPYRIPSKTEFNVNSGTNLGNVGGSNNTVTNNLLLRPSPRTVDEATINTLARKLPNKDIPVHVFIAQMGNVESNKFADAIITKLIELGYKNVRKTNGLTDAQIIGDGTWAAGLYQGKSEAMKGHYMVLINPNE